MKRKEILKMAEDTGSKYVRLCNDEGDVIVPQNNPKFNIESRAETIEKVLKSDSIYPDGTYTLEFRPSSSGHPVKFKVKKGEETTLSEQPEKIGQDEKFIALSEKLERMERLIAEMEQEPEPEPEQLAQNSPDYTPLLAALVPLADSILNRILPPQSQLSEKPRQDNKSQIAHFISSIIGELLVKVNDYDLAQAYIESLRTIDPEIHSMVLLIINSYSQKNETAPGNL